MSIDPVRQPGLVAHVGTCTMMQHLVLYDGRQSHLDLLNSTYNTSFTLKDIRAKGKFNSSSRIYCMVMFRMNLQQPAPMQVKLRVGWGEGYPPVVCQTIQSVFARAAKTGTMTNQPVVDGSNVDERGEKRPLDDANNLGLPGRPDGVLAEVTSDAEGKLDTSNEQNSKRQKCSDDCGDDEVKQCELGTHDINQNEQNKPNDRSEAEAVEPAEPAETTETPAEPAEASCTASGMDGAAQSTKQLVSKRSYNASGRG